MDEWRKARERALGRLREHASKGLVDHDIVEFLLEFNVKPCLFTTSSCSGRVAIIEGSDPFDKKGARLVEVWHDPGECRARIREYCGYRPREDRIAWASLQPPILHVAAVDERVARDLVACGGRAGFARACYKPYRAGGYIVELAGQDKTHVILPAPCGLLERLCDILEEYKGKLGRLEECLLTVEC